MVIGAPSHTLGLSFTRKPQPMSSSSSRTFRTEAVVAASGPGRGVVWRCTGGGRGLGVAEAASSAFSPGVGVSAQALTHVT